jgi:Spy/CpxP family protein refolding chaperone
METRLHRLVRQLFACGVLVTIAGQACTPTRAQAYRWWQDEVVQRELALTADQVKGLETVFASTLAERRQLRRQLDRLEAFVQRTIARADLEESEVSELIDELETTRAKRNAARTLMLFRMYRILSPEQRERLRRMQNGGTRKAERK